MKRATLAGIDIGTNTFRLLIGETDGKNIKHIASDRIVTRLGEGISDSGILKPEAVTRSISALRTFREAVDRSKAEAVSAVGTSALRKASNSKAFLSEAYRETGFDINIISDEEEARLTFLGMSMDMDIPEPALLIDIGGGSTEFIIKDKEGNVFSESLALGAVYLSETHIKNDPPFLAEITSMEEEINEKTGRLSEEMNIRGNTALFGTAGTITAVSAMAHGSDKFEHEKIHKSRVSLKEIEAIYSQLKKRTIEERIKLYPSLDAPRADIILAGTAVLTKIMSVFDLNLLTVSDYGLREGIILDLYDKITNLK
ncbi:MAG: Ppx/GppA family phosphatase [Nitrospirae bacterium]|nr:Ppx/GppA family phosphatase [Nitrospirota bacterium]